MSLPNIPNITPNISLTRHETINLLLSSIALEEIGLSHILNAEGEKIQSFLKMKHASLSELLLINKSINDTLKTVVKSQLLLSLKLEETASIPGGGTKKEHDHGIDKNQCHEDPHKHEIGKLIGKHHDKEKHHDKDKHHDKHKHHGKDKHM
ncbi:hypothetical protein [Ornithinibacillus contaminans]|uniref:hypothetical protein n=1 Tax=Ornithinibacillus contaminans TaxID=694055 RepID=UPI000A75B0FF|nr:hypothetical protein [Ornithinibacillus contaminans]